MAKNDTLGKAKKGKKNEWYTQYEDIQTELNYYEKHFEGKTVLCNCDDPYESNFCKFFLKNFNYLKLKRLICTSYTSSPIIGEQLSLFDMDEEPVKRGHGYVMDISEVPMENGRGVSDDDITKLLKSKKRGVKKLKGNGDFRSEECIEYLKEADIVVTNPPFSLFREYVFQLISYEKKFLIIGRMSALHYKEIFPLIQNNNMWTGYGFNLSLIYKTPYQNTEEANKKFVRAKGYNPDEGYVKVPAICWFTNLDIKKRHETIDLFKKYIPEEYPKYINFDAIDVNKISDIPVDYYGMMGVPDTFLDRYNAEQFEIVGLAESDLGRSIGMSANLTKEQCKELFNENKSFRAGNPIYRDKAGKLCKPFSRIIIRRKRKNNEN